MHRKVWVGQGSGWSTELTSTPAAAATPIAVQSSPQTPELVLMREACYRCIGEGYNHVSAHINFESWWVRPGCIREGYTMCPHT